MVGFNFSIYCECLNKEDVWLILCDKPGVLKRNEKAKEVMQNASYGNCFSSVVVGTRNDLSAL